MDKEQIREIASKVKKLLALSKSPNEAEASLAASKAQQLLDKFNMTLTDVEVQTAEMREESFGVKRPNGLNYTIFPFWFNICFGIVQEHFNVYVINGKGRGGSTTHFLGAKYDVEIARYVFEYLTSTIERMATQYLKTLPQARSVRDAKSRRMSYCMGVANSIYSRLMMEAASRGEIRTASNTSLVVVKRAAVEKFAKHVYPHTVRANNSTSLGRNATAYQQGQADGRNVCIRSAINNNSQQLRLA